MFSRQSVKHVFLTLAVAFSAMAQSERGTIAGTVRDQSGAIIVGAKVTVTNTANNATTTLAANEAGDFIAPSLQVGNYNVRVEKEGFRPALVTGLKLDASANIRADITLEIGTTTSAVEVAAAALQLATENAKTSSTVTNKMVDELPLVVAARCAARSIWPR